MRISVITPTFNRAPLISRALRSIFAQSHPDVEILVVDDGSTDDTEAVVRRVAADCARSVRYIKKENGGCASARNAGMREATGDCVSFLDSDDEFLPGALEALAGKLEASGADFVYSPSIYVLPDGKETADITAEPEGDFATAHFRYPFVSITAALLKKDAANRVGEFDETLRYNEDSDYFQRVGVLCRGAFLDRPGVRVHMHGGNKSGNLVGIAKAVIRSDEKILADHPDFAAKIGKLADEKRLRNRVRLAEAHLLTGDPGAAREAVASARPLPFSLRLSLALGSPIPMKIAKKRDALLGRSARNS